MYNLHFSVRNDFVKLAINSLFDKEDHFSIEDDIAFVDEFYFENIEALLTHLRSLITSNPSMLCIILAERNIDFPGAITFDCSVEDFKNAISQAVRKNFTCKDAYIYYLGLFNKTEKIATYHNIFLRYLQLRDIERVSKIFHISTSHIYLCVQKLAAEYGLLSFQELVVFFKWLNFKR